ncbi:hypothetical protein M885DRAFT_539084 [Pelagophyceae sp. CCMP2097]|nr:hypothetical protein M885DRAFT_539084 [Pelagophyceae sp. CCMP2097]
MARFARRAWLAVAAAAVGLGAPSAGVDGAARPRRSLADGDSAPLSRVVVSAASMSHAWHLGEFFKMVEKINVHRIPVALWDIGLGLERPAISALVSHVATAELRTLNFSAVPSFFVVEGGSHYAGEYAWKAYIMGEMLADFDLVLWLDAGDGVRDALALDRIFDKVATVGFWSDTSGRSVQRWVHPKLLTELGAAALAFAEHEGAYAGMCNAALVGFSRRHALYEAFFVPWRRCSMDLACIAPPGSDRWNHRQDQASLTVLAYLAGVGARYCNASAVEAKRQGIDSHLFDKKFASRVGPRNRSAYVAHVQPDPFCLHVRCP